MQYARDLIQNYPAMRPWVGCRYDCPEHKRLLVIGESHYLPPESTQHETPRKWFNGNQEMLEDKEIAWISTTEIIRGSRRENFKAKGHTIYRNLTKMLHSVGRELENPYDAIHDIAYYNYFQRPAKTGVSVAGIEEVDKKIAIEFFQSVVAVLRPELILFVSKLAWGVFDEAKLSVPGVEIGRCPHPSSMYWNKKAAKYGNINGKEVAAKFLKDNEWNSMSGAQGS